MARSIRDRLTQARDGAVSTEDAPPDAAADWYVIHTYSGYENKVRQNLQARIESMDVADRIFEILVPTQAEIEIKGGQRETVQRKVFPGYVLVKMKMDDESWYVVRNTPGVTSFVGMGHRPTPLGESEVLGIIKGMTAEAPRVKLTLSIGDPVRITGGPFADFRGTIDEINHDRGKVKVLVSFFGREVPVELDPLEVERET